MVPLQSRIEQMEADFAVLKKELEPLNFTLGGNWDYERGFMDANLDGVNKVWLRLPFRVTAGRLDAETEGRDIRVILGTPFVLKHVYNEGTDPEAHIMVMGGLTDQFQDPVNPDATVEPQWVQKGQQLLKQVEQRLA